MDHFRAGLKRHVPSSAEMGPPFKSEVLGVVRAGGTVAPGDTARIGPRPLRFVPTCFVGAVHDASCVSSMTGHRGAPRGEAARDEPRKGNLVKREREFSSI
jgi:hypothetical protein